jgi:Carboxypeptidase regulatory-like domain/TonB dependent receptor
MNRVLFAAAFALLTFGLPSAYAQTPARSTHNTFPAGRIEGRVLDDKLAPVIGAMVSVVGRTTAVATTDSDGRYSLKDLPFGPYVLSVHSRGYWQSRGRTVQLTASKMSAPEIQLTRVNPGKAPVASGAATPVASVAPAPTQFAGFGDLGPPALPVALGAPATAATGDGNQEAEDGAGEGGETAWRLRHLPRSILKETATEAAWVSTPGFEPHGDWLGRDAVADGPATLFSNLALSGQINFLTSESFNSPGQLLGPNGARSVAFVSVGTQAAGGAWAMQGAMTQGDLASWIVAGSYKSIDSASHAYDVGLSYSTQRYDGGNAAALEAINDSARNVGAVYGYDQWTVSPRLVLGYGSGYARYDYLGGSGLWSPRVSITIPIDGLRVKAVASSHAVVPGAEEFAPSVAGLWLPPERTFSSLAMDGTFRPERTRHMEMSLERDLATGVTVSVRGFGQRVSDQLIEMFGVDLPGRPETPLGHYFVGTAGDIDARGWGVGMTQEVPGYFRGTIEYTVATAYWVPSAESSMFSRGARSVAATSSENVYDLQTSMEATIPQTATKIYAKYRMNTAFWSAEADRLAQPNANTRFNVRVNQSLPFLRFYNADWEMLVDIRNMFRDADALASLYDEALAVRAPKRIVGGLLVKF